MTRIFTDYRRSLKQIQTNNHITEEMSITLAVTVNKNGYAGILKNMVPDPKQFDGNQTKFEDWWRGIRLFLKSNRVMEINDRITAILAHLRGGVASIYAQRKLDELDKETRTQNWEEFVWEIKTTFSDKTKIADAEWKIETFKQEKKNTADFMIEFNTLAMKTDTDELYTIFLLKKNVQHNIIKTILGYLPMAAPEILKKWKMAITSVEQGYESTEGRHNYKTNIGTMYGGQGQPMRTLKMESLSASTTTSTNIWQRNAKQRRRNKRLEHASNVTGKDISPKIAKRNKQ